MIKRLLLSLTVFFIISTSYSQLTDEEKDFIKSNSVVRVGNEMDWPPFDYVEEGLPTGYSIDLIQLAAEKSGFTIEFVNQLTWAELMEAFKKGEIDLLPAVYEDEDRKKFMSFTKPYFAQPTVIVSNPLLKVSSLKDLSGKK